MTQMKPLARILTGAVVGTIFALALIGLMTLITGKAQPSLASAITSIVMCAAFWSFLFAVGSPLISDALSYIYNPDARRPYKR